MKWENIVKKWRQNVKPIKQWKQIKIGLNVLILLFRTNEFVYKKNLNHVNSFINSIALNAFSLICFYLFGCVMEQNGLLRSIVFNSLSHTLIKKQQHQNRVCFSRWNIFLGQILIIIVKIIMMCFDTHHIEE